jgi:GNAT superfamily N-acetyltransferase
VTRREYTLPTPSAPSHYEKKSASCPALPPARRHIAKTRHRPWAVASSIDAGRVTTVRLVLDPLLDNPRSFTAKVAGVLGGTAIERPRLTGFLNSKFDPFLNQLAATGPVRNREAAEALEGRPGFVWLAEEPSPSEVAGPGAETLSLVLMCGMTATTAGSAPPQAEAEICDVRSREDLHAWHEVYCEVFGGDVRGRREWERIHDALGPFGDRSLLLLSAWVDGSPAATGGVYFESDVAGLYCFTTRERMRGRGLATALVHASHAAAHARGVERALLQATPSGRPVYSKAGYREERTLPVLIARGAPAEGASSERS